MKSRKILAIMMLIGIVGLTGCGNKVSNDNKAEEDKKVETEVVEEPVVPEEKHTKEEVAELLIGTWGNETAFSDDEVMKFSGAYYTEFNEDGSVIQHGYRNTDKGTYEIMDENVVIALFDHNYYEDPADPDNHDVIEGYVYEVIYHVNHNDGTLDAKYSKDFHEMVMSNATDGILTKMDPVEEEEGLEDGFVLE